MGDSESSSSSSSHLGRFKGARPTCLSSVPRTQAPEVSAVRERVCGLAEAVEHRGANVKLFVRRAAELLARDEPELEAGIGFKEPTNERAHRIVLARLALKCAIRVTTDFEEGAEAGLAATLEDLHRDLILIEKDLEPPTPFSPLSPHRTLCTHLLPLTPPPEGPPPSLPTARMLGDQVVDLPRNHGGYSTSRQAATAFGIFCGVGAGMWPGNSFDDSRPVGGRPSGGPVASTSAFASLLALWSPTELEDEQRLLIDRIDDTSRSSEKRGLTLDRVILPLGAEMAAAAAVDLGELDGGARGLLESTSRALLAAAEEAAANQSKAAAARQFQRAALHLEMLRLLGGRQLAAPLETSRRYARWRARHFSHLLENCILEHGPDDPRNFESVYDCDAADVLGRGGYGVVYRCTRRVDAVPFACKVLDLGLLSSAELAQLHEEINAMRELDHPHICRLREVFYSEQRQCHLVMELCEGGELFAALERECAAKAAAASPSKRLGLSSSSSPPSAEPRAFSEARVADLAMQMLGSIRYMHDSGVCHRDIKLENWLFDGMDTKTAHVKLVDFGLARVFGNQVSAADGGRTKQQPPPASPSSSSGSAPETPEGAATTIRTPASSSSTSTGDNNDNYYYARKSSSMEASWMRRSVRSLRGVEFHNRVGSAYYCAPEVLSGDYDGRCDLWSFGVIVYMLLSGAPPFYGTDDRDILRRVRCAPLAFPKELFGPISDTAKSFIRGLLDREVDRRLTADEAMAHPFIAQRHQRAAAAAAALLEKSADGDVAGGAPTLWARGSVLLTSAVRVGSNKKNLVEGGLTGSKKKNKKKQNLMEGVASVVEGDGGSSSLASEEPSTPSHTSWVRDVENISPPSAAALTAERLRRAEEAEAASQASSSSAPPGGLLGALRSFAELDALRRMIIEVAASQLPPKRLVELRNDFLAADADGDGILTIGELHLAIDAELRQGGGRRHDTGVDAEEVARLFDVIDIDSSQKISYHEFVAAALSRRLHLDDRALQAAFDAIDSEGLGYLTAESVLATLGLDDRSGDHEEIRRALGQADTNGNNMIDYAEFLAFFRSATLKAFADAPTSPQQQQQQQQQHSPPKQGKNSPGNDDDGAAAAPAAEDTLPVEQTADRMIHANAPQGKSMLMPATPTLTDDVKAARRNCTSAAVPSAS